LIPRKIFDKCFEKILRPPNAQQLDAINPGPEASLFVVAGPGSGKTTVLTVRILKLILVDGVAPKSILATTFTKKAAAELRSRILGRGFKLIELLLKDNQLNSAQKKWLEQVDINQTITGTIDSICEQLLRDYREAGTQSPLLADDFISSTLLLREGLLDSKRYMDGDLDQIVRDLQDNTWGMNINKKVDFLYDIWNRRFNDQVEWAKFVTGATPEEGNARQIIDEALNAYQSALSAKGMVDFPMLEQEVLNRLKAGKLKEFTDNLQVVLVDEYQDTNLLQESIYFALAKSCQGALTVVGDDDQSLYRFRGATVQLFSDFPARYKHIFKKKPVPVFLTTNYRSTKTIVDFVNDFARFDADYQDVRVAKKPALEYKPKAEQGLPILGMFRNDLDTLGQDLANFIHQVFRGKGFKLPSGETIKRDPRQGDLGDCALLCSSPQEVKYDGSLRLPGILREKLVDMSPPVEVFNPRGQALANLDLIEVFGGLILECLDPGGDIQDKTSGLSPDIISILNRWRQAAIDFANDPDCPAVLVDFAVGWADRDPGKKDYRWPTNVPLLDLVYGLVHWFPDLYDDPEGQIYLEVFTRQISSTETIGSFEGRVVTDPGNKDLSDKSVMELLRNVLVPIASGSVKVNEELMDSFPRDRLSILSIHQSKGLEFPLVIVDVGSDFKSSHWTQAFKRFPRGGGKTHRFEDLMRSYTPLGPETRSGLNRAFDDLYRQYFVAYSRPEQVLLLVGLNGSLPGRGVHNVATGRDRKGNNRWPDCPFLLIP
jgi:DNA helicase-2/ATP-dependent DNA helicase PcrA